METDDGGPNTSRCYTALFRPDPPEATVSEEGAKTLRKLADQVAQIDGFQELARDERPSQVEVHIRRDN